MTTRNQTHNHPQKPAARSKKSRGRKGKGQRSAELQAQALTNATEGNSAANYDAIFEGFDELGIAPEDIIPRVNVFTFNAWKALGRVVRKGQHGVQVRTVIPCERTNKESGEVERFTRPKVTTVFHVSQTEPLPTGKPADAGSEDPDELAKARAAGFGCVAAWKNPTFMADLAEHSQRFAEENAKAERGERADFAHAFAPLTTTVH